jgi:hypothetical protein
MLRPLHDLSAWLESPRVRPAVLVGLVLALLVGTAASFGVAERLKLERSPVAAPRIQRILGPTCDCPRAKAALSFALRRADRVTASVVDGNGTRVRFLVQDERYPKGRVSLVWDGRNDEGEVVHDGRYRLRVALGDAGRTITIPTPVRVDTKPPHVRLVDVSPRVFSPDGDGKGDRVLYRYRSSELGRAQVLVDGKLAVRGRRPAGLAQIRWRGRLEGEIAPIGVYRTRLTVVDAAGNESRPTREITVRIRYVRLLNVLRRVGRGGVLTFTIDADAERVEWSLRGVARGSAGLDGGGPPGNFRVRLRGRVPRGICVLEATTPAGADRARIRIVG